MDVELTRSVLGWCALVNIGLFLAWFLVFTMAHDAVYKLHRIWFSMSKEEFDKSHYIMMGVYKLIIVSFFVIPYLAMQVLA